MSSIKRRDFIKFGLSAIASSGCLNLSSQLFGNEKSQKTNKSFTDYKALVCIYMAGGVDGYHMLLPANGTKYDEYKTARKDIAVPQSQILGLDPITTQGFNVGVHYKMPGVKTLFEDKKLAFIANVGNLIKPTTSAQYKDAYYKKPDQLFSHNSQTEQWLILKNKISNAAGWAGRMVDSFASESVVPSAINLAGQNLWLPGASTIPYKLKSSGIVPYEGMKNEASNTEMKRRDIFLRMMEPSKYKHPFQKAYVNLHRNSMAIASSITNAFNKLPAITTTIPAGNSLAENLMAVAKMIASQNELNMKRQVFYVQMSGYDTHDKQITTLENNFSKLDEAITMFQAALAEYGAEDRTVSFLASEFGRSLTSNGDGTDHGWGNHLFAFGKPIKGGEIYGTMPVFQVNGPDDSRNGRIIPTLSADQYASTFANWFGFDETERLSLFENLANFDKKTIDFL